MLIPQKPGSPEEVYLEHFGVKGQKWGVRRTQRKERQAARNAQIDAARARVNSGKTRSEFEAARAKFKAQKKAGRKDLVTARRKASDEIAIARQVKSGSETTKVILTVIGTTAISSILKATLLTAAGR